MTDNQSFGLGRRIVPATAAATALAFALLLIPVSHRDYSEIAVAAALGLALIALSAAWRVTPQIVELGVPIGYLLVIAVLRDAAGGGTSGFGGLFLLPIIYLALYAPRAELLLGLGAMTCANVIPILAIGAPKYPTTSWRGTFVQVLAAAVAGFTIQHLVSRTRARAIETGEQNVRLKEIDQMRDEFVGLITHELRTPLTSIVGYLELLTEDPLEDRQRRYASVIEDNAQRLIRLVNDLLLVSRIESGALVELNLQSVDLDTVVQQSIESVRPRADAKKLEVSFDRDGVPAFDGDPVRIGQLVDNLLSNAVKYTPEQGSVSVATRRLNGNAVVTVRDSGIGIPAADQEQLFQRFFRSSNAASAKTPGTGLGLTIAKAIAEAHGGTIAFESSSAGTTFRVELPLVA